jgi:hypothetical protein
MIPEELNILFDVVLAKRRLLTEALVAACKRKHLETDIGYELVKRHLYDFSEQQALGQLARYCSD